MRISDWSSDVCSSYLIAAFKRAIAADPDFALAWAELSIARANARFWGVDQSKANLQAEEMEAKRALALAPRLPETHIAMGHVQRFVHHDFAAARDEFQRSEEHTSELQSLMRISYAVFCLKKKQK